MIAPDTLRDSLKRLCTRGEVSEKKLKSMMIADPPKLDQEDYDYITDKPA